MEEGDGDEGVRDGGNGVGGGGWREGVGRMGSGVKTGFHLKPAFWAFCVIN